MAVSVFAQAPSNDDCSNPIALTIAANAGACTATAATTLNATPSLTAGYVCSGSWFSDDVWFSFTTGMVAPVNGVTIELGGGVPTFGMALYTSCATDAVPFNCFSGSAATVTTNVILAANTTYYARVWSGGGATANSGAFDICVFENEPDLADVIWSDDFSDPNLTGWVDSSTTGTEWLWMPAPTAGRGNFADSSNVINSPSSSNGGVVFDSDYYDNSGIAGAPQSGILTSASIDCSNADVVVLEFSQQFRQYLSTFSVSYSIDGGTTYTDIEINSAAVINSPHTYTREAIFLAGAANQSDVKIRFVFAANYYYWILDDVRLVNAPIFSAIKINDFNAVSTAYSFPVNNADPIRFIADIENEGSTIQTNVNLNVQVTDDATGTVVYTDDLVYGTLIIDELAENKVFPNTFTPDDSQPGAFTIMYTLSSDSTDTDSTDNVFSHSFIISDSTFSKVTSINNAISPADDNNYTYGTHYHLYQAEGSNDPNDTLVLDNMQFGCGNVTEMIGTSVDIYVYEWNDIDGNLSVGALGTELTIASLATYSFTGGETDNVFITVPLEDFNNPGSKLELKDNTDYIVVVQYNAPNTTLDFRLSTNDEINYAATDLAADSFGIARISELLDVGNTGDLNGGFTGNNIPALVLNFATKVFDNTSTDVIELPSNSLKVFPSPATDYVNVDIDLENLAENVTITVYDIKGQLLQTKQMSNVKQDRATFDVSDFAAGRYLVNITADNGVITKFFTVVR